VNRKGEEGTPMGKSQNQGDGARKGGGRAGGKKKRRSGTRMQERVHQKRGIHQEMI